MKSVKMRIASSKKGKPFQQGRGGKRDVKKK